MSYARAVRQALLIAIVLVACDKKPEAVPVPAAQPAAPAPLGDAAEAVAQVRIGGNPDAPRHALALAIEAVHENQKPIDKAPFYAAGGKWTYLDLKTPGGAAFTVGVNVERVLQGDDPITMYDVRAQETDPTQGAAVIEELAKALGTSVPAKPAVDKTPRLVPLAMVASQLGGDTGRNPDGSFSGTGSWKATKWTSERAGHAAEIYFNFSLADTKAELSEKDGDYNADIVADLALALRDGGAVAKK